MLWIALFIPELPLQSVEARLLDTQSGSPRLPHVISEGPDTRPVLCAVNSRARDLGIRPGQTVSMARALVGDLLVTPRNIDWEQEALVKIATIASEFTPMVSLDRECVLLEISASLKLFGGLGQLFASLRIRLHESGFSALAGIAPTPLAARLFAKARMTRPGRRGALNETDLSARLADLPLALFGWSHSRLATLAQLGLTRVKDLTVLPRDGLTRRFGKEVVHDIDRALGRVSDPRDAFILPATFSTRVEFIREVVHFEGLRFPIRRMLSELACFLRARGAATSGWTLAFLHNRSQQTALHITTQRPSRDWSRWETLLAERVARTPLGDEVCAMTLCCDKLQPYEEENLSWLPDQRQQACHMSDLLERLSARLGQGSVYGISIREDHRPEQAWTRQSVSTQPTGSGKLPTGHVPPWPLRPLWLLPAPRILIARDHLPHYHGALKLLSGPERIEYGWWDGQPARRDYFVAQNPLHETLWVYRALSPPHEWFLHGHFS